MGYIRLDYSKVTPSFGTDDLHYYQERIDVFHKAIRHSFESEHNSLGWVDLPVQFDKEELKHIKRAASKVKKTSDVLLVIGIGGSYLGSRAAIEMLTHSFYNLLPKEKRTTPQLFFVGHNLSSVYISDLMELLEGKDFSINVISKSGTTMEPAIAFRIFRQLLVDRYGEMGAKSRIYVTTDGVKGSLKTVATLEGYETFAIPENIGGRYSVLTAVGLFPIAVSGICIDELLRGARAARGELDQRDVTKNAAYQYAAIRNSLYKQGKTIELLVSYEPNFHYFAEWWKQLYAESEGKNNKGIFPTSAIFSTDLHSLGQYIQEGRQDLFETIIQVQTPQKELVIETETSDFDELNYLGGRTVEFVKNKAFEGALLAHTEGGTPNLIIQIPEINPFTFGYLVYFFQLSCAMSGYLLGVNPFNQPGVEAYKKNMFHLLDRPGYEKKQVEVVQVTSV
ncbi:glucose-6-phosphate isomerase [Sporosarcina sp. FSL K6-1522]|uniref:glucose-6-phosphate isomerase n=1 Tax=Sporosarcina sp. FSL K6-1522 TaxID=2921554 RepID=UPI00315A8E38